MFSPSPLHWPRNSIGRTTPLDTLALVFHSSLTQKNCPLQSSSSCKIEPLCQNKRCTESYKYIDSSTSKPYLSLLFGLSGAKAMIPCPRSEYLTHSSLGPLLHPFSAPALVVPPSASLILSSVAPT